MNDNPFAEEDDRDRTIMRPIRGIMPAPRAASPAPPPELPEMPASGGAEKLPSHGGSPILAAAAPLLQLLARLRTLLTLPDPAMLRDRAIQELRGFETELRRRNVPMDQIRTSHYALSASLDDVVQSMPWGGRGPWADASLVSTFHQEVKSGERFFELLKQLSQNAGKFLPVIELMYVCLALGMQGRYRLSPRGPAELDRVREETYLVIMRQRAPLERGLSLHWQGVSAPYRPVRAVLPVWVAALCGLGLLALLYVLFAFGLNDASDRLFEAGLALPPAQMPAITRTAPPQPLPLAPPPAPGERDKLASFLAPEVQQGLVVIAGTDAVPIIRLVNKSMFASGSAVVERQYLPILDRVAAALKDEPGQIAVVGYTDNQPIHTVQFPSNFQLSEARAKAAAAILEKSVDAQRVTTAGRADADPIASNTTPDGQQQNRRIEIVLRRSGTS